MIIMNIKLDNFLLFNDFELCTSYPKKIVNSGIGEEHLEGKPNFRYKKLIILMGANATGKTALGRVLMTIYNFIYYKEYNRIISLIEDNKKEATFSIDFVFEGKELYRVSTKIAPQSKEGEYKSEDIKVSVISTSIYKSDNYENCVKRLDEKQEKEFSNYIEALETVPNLSWGFEFPYEPKMRLSDWDDDKSIYDDVLKRTLITLDPRITDVVPMINAKDTFIVSYPHCNVLIKNGKVVDDGILSAGTVEGIGIAVMVASMKVHRASFYYCDEKFSHIHSEAERAYLSLLIDLIGSNEQLFITTHNMDVLDMNIPKHSFAFLRRDENDNNQISCVFASDYLKKNTESLKNAVENDVFSSSPDISGIYELKNIGG